MCFSRSSLLVVNADPLSTRGITQSLTALGYTYDVTTTTAFSTMPPDSLLAYQAVLYAGNGGYDTLAQMTTYLDNGGHLLITGDDWGYYYSQSNFYQQYLEAQYLGDDATRGPGSVVGEDIMAGLSGDISADPWPDDSAITGAHTTRLFVYATSGPGNNYPAGHLRHSHPFFLMGALRKERPLPFRWRPGK